MDYIKSFFIRLFSCFSETESHGDKSYYPKTFATSNGRDIIFEDLETTYLFERDDDNINFR